MNPSIFTTIKTFDDLQTIFDKVAKHLLAQRKRAQNRLGGACVYRSSDGLKCAIGCLIPDEHYDPLIEGTVISDLEFTSRSALLLKNILLKSGINTEDSAVTQLLMQLQLFHDDFDRDFRDWEKSLENLADKWELKFNNGSKS